MRSALRRIPRRHATPVAAAVPIMLAGLVAGHGSLPFPGGDGPRVHAVPENGPLGYVAGGDDALDDLPGAHPVTFPPGTAAQVRSAVSREQPPGPDVSATALPARVLAAYRSAATSLQGSDPGCRLSWPLLAGIGKVESGHARGGAVDRSGLTLTPILGPVLDGGPGVAAIPDTDGGRWDTDETWDRAVGPMQFIPSSWAVHGADGNNDGASDPNNVLDASLASGGYLCTGDRDLSREKDRRAAVFSYNHSWDYVDLVLAWADAYADGTPVLTGALAGAGGGTSLSGRAGSGSGADKGPGPGEQSGRTGGPAGTARSVPGGTGIPPVAGAPPASADGPAGSGPGSEPASQPGSGSGSEPGSGAGSEPGSGAGSEPGSGSGSEPSGQPTSRPSSEPSSQPTSRPSSEPSSGPSSAPPSPEPEPTCPTPSDSPSPTGSPSASSTTEPSPAPSPTQSEASATPTESPTPDPCT